MSAVTEELARLEEMSGAELRAAWLQRCGATVPRISPRLMRHALAWEIQAHRLGGFSRETVRTLDQLTRGATVTAPASAGMRLVREWQGRTHVVTIGEDRVIRWDQREWKSLSQVARAITGTRWSGPAFFGLKRKVAA